MAGVDMRRFVWFAALSLTLPAQGRESELEMRVRQLEQRLSSQALIEMSQQVDQLQGEVQSLRGQVEALEYQMKQLRESQKRQYLDLDVRMRSLEGSAPTPEEGREPTVPDEGEPKAAEPVQSTLPSTEPSPNETQAYQAAYQKLQAGHYDAAIDAFSKFLQDHPNVALAANAYYWLGEAYYVKRDFNAAQASFRQVVDRFPASGKVPDALLKLGYVAYEQGRWSEARRHLEEVVNHFPNTRAASLAGERLERMKQERRI